MRLLRALALLAILAAGCGQTKKGDADLGVLLELHNERRAAVSAKQLQLDQYLCDYAKKHSDWMAKKNSMRHSNIGVLVGTYRTAGENIAWNQRGEQDVMAAWMNSRPHKANILNKNFSKVGFAMSRNSKGQPYWCTVFAD
jgi:uncharacterized protein YkwD